MLDGLAKHAEVGGLWADTEKLDGAQFFFGVDASGRSRSKDARIFLCSWGTSAMALNGTGQWHRNACKSGLLPRRKQLLLEPNH